MNKHVAIVLLAAFVACAAAGCKRDQEPHADTDAVVAAPRNPGGSGSAEVTYRPEVRVVEQRAGLDALLSVSTDGSTFVFDRHHGAVPALVKGDVLLIKGLL
ncbi:MAG: hypothetical protein LH470_10150, partial [Lysobacter sp.]|nr:hypothetical protein [Lysobacter sp.]